LGIGIIVIVKNRLVLAALLQAGCDDLNFLLEDKK
jgi:hypothetical protein